MTDNEQRLVVAIKIALTEMDDTEEHDYNCIGYSEGVECCITKAHIHTQLADRLAPLIEQWLSEKFEAGYNQAKQDAEKAMAKLFPYSPNSFTVSVIRSLTPKPPQP